MTASERITAKIIELPSWQGQALARLRDLIRQADPDITEDWKWNNPAWTHAGLVCGVFAARDWLHVTFHQGALVPDPHHLFNDGLDNQAGRVIKLRPGDALNEAAFQDLVRAAVQNNLAGRKFVNQPEPQEEIVLEPFIRDALRDTGLVQAFEDRPYYQRKHWPEWITAAKQPATQKRRLDSMLQELRSGEYMAPKGGWSDGQGGRRQL